MSEEKDRLMTLLKENKISQSEYKLLSQALDKKSSRLTRLASILINPFEKIAGLYALIAGFFVILTMSYMGVIAKVFFPGILDCLNSTAVKNPKYPLSFIVLLYQNLVSWLILTALFIAFAKIFQQRRIRIIDFLGTVALSRYPFLVLTLFLGIIRVLNPAFMNIDFTKGLQYHPSMMTIVFTFVVAICVIWQIVTYFYALKESSGLLGKKLWVSFIASLVLGEIISNLLTMMVVSP